MKQSVGIDVSKASLDVCYKTKDEKPTKYHQVFDNTGKGHRQLLKWLNGLNESALTDIYIVLEATGVYHLVLAKTLHEKGMPVCILNPLQSHYYAKGLGLRGKTDKLDSHMLACYGLEREMQMWKPASQDRIELKALNTRLFAVDKDIRREQNRLESAQTADQSKVVVRLIKQSIRALEKQAEKLIELIDEHIDQHEDLKNDRKLLLSIPGIGEVCSRYLLGDIYQGRFKSSAQCAAYMGLVPVPKQSGNRATSSLSRAGNRKLKAKLYMAAIVAKQHNPILKKHYDQLIARGKCKMSALCAVMRRLVQICFGVIKHQKEFCL